MKLNNLSKIGLVGGFLLFLATEVRYFILTQDLDKAIYFGIISLLIMAVSWIWNLLTDTRKVQDQIEIYLSELNKGDDNGRK